LTRVVDVNGATLVGQYFPPGTEVGVNPWIVHDNTDVFGHDAAEFKSGQWLLDDAEKHAVMDRNFLAFRA
jgi:cytochrome P450